MTSSSRLCDLSVGSQGTVLAVRSPNTEADPQLLHRLGELGFLPGEPVHLVRRGPGGREPLAVQIGETMFALRWVEAQCIEVSVP